MEVCTELFINIIRKYRLVYDKASKDFKNVNLKELAWGKIAVESRMNVAAAKKRYNSLRQKYSREKRKEIISMRSGRSTGKASNWVFFEKLDFLDDFIVPRSTYTNDTLYGFEGDMYNQETQEDVDADTDGMIGDEDDVLNLHNDDTEGDYCNDILIDTFAHGEHSVAFDQLDERLMSRFAAEVGKENQTRIQKDDNILTGNVRVSDPQSSNKSFGCVNKRNNGNDSPAPAPLSAQFKRPSTCTQQIPPITHSDGNINMSSRDRGNNDDDTPVPVNDQLKRSSTSTQQIPPFTPTSLNENINMLFRGRGNDDDDTLAPVNTQLKRSSTSTQQIPPFTPTSLNGNINMLFRGRGNDDDDTLAPVNTQLKRPSTSTQQIPPFTPTSLNGNINMLFRDRGNDDDDTPAVASANAQFKRPYILRPQNLQRQPISRTGQPLSQAGKSLSPNADKATGTNMEAIKRKMDSYLTASTKKLTDSVQRSPHAPFLTYLGSKLDGVPSEIMPALEKAILDTVFSFSNDHDE